MIDLNELQAAIDRCAFDGDVLGLSKSECTSLLAMLRESEKDAARYRWLRDNVCMFYVSAEGCDNKEAYLTVTGYGNDDSSAVVDAAIDEQMKETGDE